jgi:hypothetical protein
LLLLLFIQLGDQLSLPRTLAPTFSMMTEPKQQLNKINEKLRWTK